MSDKVLNKRTNRMVKVGTQSYRNALRSGDIEPPKTVEAIEPEPVEEPEPEFSESKLQKKLADISTDMIKDNMKQILKAQKLTDSQMDDMLKKMLYKKLCIEEPKKKTKPKKKFKIKEPSSSESESD